MDNGQQLIAVRQEAKASIEAKIERHKRKARELRALLDEIGHEMESYPDTANNALLDLVREVRL